MSHYNKYLKYKNKYLQYKNSYHQTAGNKYNNEQIDEIHFWGQQMSEHAEFLYLGIEDANLKNKGLELHTLWQTFMTDNFDSKGISSKGKIVLDDSDFAKINSNNYNNLDYLIVQLREYKQEIIRQLDAGKWLGWIYSLFVKHMLTELEYFNDKLNNIVLPREEEIRFYNTMNAQHAGIIAHLLGPDLENDSLISKANRLYHKITNLSHLETNSVVKKVDEFYHKIVTDGEDTFLKLSLDDAKELDVFNNQIKTAITSNQVKSIIHPVLINHIIYAGKRSIYVLENIKKN